MIRALELDPVILDPGVCTWPGLAVKKLFVNARVPHSAAASHSAVDVSCSVNYAHFEGDEVRW